MPHTILQIVLAGQTRRHMRLQLPTGLQGLETLSFLQSLHLTHLGLQPHDLPLFPPILLCMSGILVSISLQLRNSWISARFANWTRKINSINGMLRPILRGAAVYCDDSYFHCRLCRIVGHIFGCSCDCRIMFYAVFCMVKFENSPPRLCLYTLLADTNASGTSGCCGGNLVLWPNVSSVWNRHYIRDI